MLYQGLDIHRHHVRLITILRLKPHTSLATPVECHLQDVCIDDEYLTLAYKQYLNYGDTAGGWQDPERFGGRVCPGHEMGTSLDQMGMRPLIYRNFAMCGVTSWLSAIWGDPTISREILVNGDSLMVTKNLDDCLRALRNKQYTLGEWKFWMDAICINQQDIVERASQVGRTREIYTKFWTPLIWLGEQEVMMH